MSDVRVASRVPMFATVTGQVRSAPTGTREGEDTAVTRFPSVSS
ncbi:hypothetical protein [Archangium violaceum]|nr:hypothetical protein [Archangium violaceum]